MIVKFFVWFVVFGLSFLVEELGFAEQGMAFICIHILASCLLVIASIFISIYAGKGTGERIVFPLLIVGMYILIIAIILFATWGATKLFGVDFFVAYQIMTFGQCLCSSSKDNN